MSLRVVDPGLHTLVVDFGRPRSRSLGVPVGGAADRFSLAIGNALVGNPPDTAALEVTLAGPTLHGGCDLACVVYGAPFDMTCAGRRLTADRTFTFRAGDTLHIGGTPTRMRAYFCVRGGIEVPEVLDSRSGLAPLRAGEELLCQRGDIGTRWIPTECGPSQNPTVLRVMDGPQADWFDGDQLTRRLFTVTPASNRMGLRLHGEPLTLPKRELVSEPVCPGAVQVTRDGQCIILGVDGQTIGGYPKIALIISADLDAVGQLRPGDKIVFQRVTLDEAESIRCKKRSVLQDWIVRLQTTS